ncbi:MAG: DEAD/DEAH box helicase, partial [Anaerolineae bacterium]
MHDFSPGQTIEGPFWSEPLRVLAVHPVGRGLQIEAVGLRSRRYYDHTLQPNDLAQVRAISPADRTFSGDAESFFLALEAHRIRLAHQFDPLLAVNISQVDPLPHQIDAVYHHILRQPRIRFLLADDPGAGKTIMAGLLLKELQARGLVHRALIVVPGHLKDQWLREMKERFGETFTVVDRAVVGATWGRNIWQEQSWIITSMDFAKQDEVMAALAETTWDLVVVDEAHKLSATRYGRKIYKTQRYQLGEAIAQRATHMLFLTATPHRGDDEAYFLLLSLLEPRLFANPAQMKVAARADGLPFVLRRAKD